MFVRMFSWFRRRRLSRRALFTYWNGREWRHADPAVIWRQLHAVEGGNLGDLVRLADAGREPAATIVYDHLVKVFDLDELDPATGTGVTRWEALEMVQQFWECVSGLKKKFSRGWIPWQLLALESSTSPADPDEAQKSSPASDSASNRSASSESTTLPEESRPA